LRAAGGRRGRGDELPTTGRTQIALFKAAVCPIFCSAFQNLRLGSIKLLQKIFVSKINTVKGIMKNSEKVKEKAKTYMERIKQKTQRN
jgi:hypothetical protein